jgi:IS1 family transposase
VPAPADDVIEIDEVCIRVTPSLWLWVAVSRLVGQVLGFVIGNRTDAMLALCWSDVPQDYRDKPVCTDRWGAYGRFFGSSQHEACDKGSGKTSHSQGWNTKWRQRQSGLVRRSCGVYAGIETDLVERFLLLVDGHNRQCARGWNRQRPTEAATLSIP